ncbi:MAG: nucleotidyltransferase domain-containing protein, partial [Bacteroidetes bacterium]|nr:nucleotidyltransferase domain-containing protein [Bacteroidota bacterium]
DKIILFGSYASGIPNENSDLDLLIIKDTNEPIHCRDFHIRKYLIGTAVPMDIIVYTNTEYEEEKKNKYSFISSTLLTSKIVYERRK